MKKINKKFMSVLAMVLLILPIGVFLSCNDDDNFTDVVPDVAEAIIRSFQINDEYAVIDHTSGVITLTLPAGTDLTSLVSNITVPDGTVVTPESGSTLDFSNGPVVFNTLAKNGANREYTATIGAYGDPKILDFTIGENQGVIDYTENTIRIDIGSEDGNIKSLTPNFVIADGTTVDVASGVSRDFSSPVVYTVSSNDGFSALEFTVYVNQTAAPQILSFMVDSESGNIDEEAATIAVFTDANTDLTKVTPVIEVPEGQTVSPTSGTEQDFSNGAVAYSVTNSEGLTKVYSVTVESVASSGTVAFISGADSVDAISEPDTKAAAVWMKNNYPQDFVYIQASKLTTEDLNTTKVVYFYWDNTGSQEMPDGGISADKVEIITNYYKNGGHLIVSGFGINYLDDFGRININGTIFTNEGGNSNPVGGENLDVWGLRGTYTVSSPPESANHPILTGLDKGTYDYYPMNNAQFKEDRNMGIDFGWPEYNDLFTQAQCTEERAEEFEAATNSILIRWYEWLDSRGCGIGLAEFKPQGDYQGTMILNTGGWLEWSMADNNGAVNDYQNNIYQLHKNAIDYLLKF